MPGTQIRRDGGKFAHQGLLDRKSIERLLAGGAVNASAGLLHHPASRLLVQIRQIAEGAGGEEVTLDVLNSGLHHTLLCRVRRRTRVDLIPA